MDQSGERTLIIYEVEPKPLLTKVQDPVHGDIFHCLEIKLEEIFTTHTCQKLVYIIFVHVNLRPIISALIFPLPHHSMRDSKSITNRSSVYYIFHQLS